MNIIAATACTLRCSSKQKHRPATSIAMTALASTLMFYSASISAAEAIVFSEQELSVISSFGPWPPKFESDSSNRVSGNSLAREFGRTLFFDTLLSKNNDLACASCHQADKYFTDGLALAQGAVELERNTQSLMNIAGNRWFGWGGESDSLWSHSIRPLTSEQEMASSADIVKERILNNTDYRQLYSDIFKTAPNDDDSDTVMINVSKALAAYQETLISPRTQFDQFRDAVVVNNQTAMARYPEPAKRGLKLFINEGNCQLCHLGANFSSKEFADAAVPYFTRNGVDSGRYQGIKTVMDSPYNLLSQYNDAAEKADIESNTLSIGHVQLQHKNWGEFKIPSLRGALYTAPYMHNGSLKSLQEVVQHYSNIDEERLHSDGVNILRPLNLTEQQANDLLLFLQTLSIPESQ
ncbi:cytochrome-c peroxidase [Reinekea thalattae]|uniref:Cytochrome c domain-containing protein n=1 Tax=Reinekea thalattae TaxID=2593301 RepID=A0A5C8Z8F9_9GAMM|nr:cytochrome c peroxidase [Reinekea thalattae]TXR54192.1 hypothetical protein FME95_06555 [Reinekea thalattae]